LRSILLILASGCIWISDEELMSQTASLEDRDGDGYSSMEYGGRDCDDANDEVHPAAEEVPYDGLDNDCNALSVDDDLDGDGFALDRDCDDEDATRNPDAIEICDGVDNDCEGTIDGTDAADALTYHPDDDGDGFGQIYGSEQYCEPPSGMVIVVDDEFDCDDRDISIYPGADEYCDGEDNDCDDVVDEQGAVDQISWYPDRDGDGFGDTDSEEVGCSAPSDYLEVAGDCDDSDPNVNPDALEGLGDLEDRDCDGLADGFHFTSLDTQHSVNVVGPRLVVTPTSGGPLLYLAWMAEKCTDETSGITEIRNDCMLFSTVDLSSWSSIRAGVEDIFVQSSAEEVAMGHDGDFVADPIYAAWVRDVVTDEGPELRVFGINRVNEDTAIISMNLESSPSISQTQAALNDSTLTAASCSEGGELNIYSLALDDLVDGELSETVEHIEENLDVGVCEVNEYADLIYTGDYGGDLSSWALEVDIKGGSTLDQMSNIPNTWFLDLEHSLSPNISAMVGTHDDATNRLHYRFQMIPEMGSVGSEIDYEEDWLYTSQVFEQVDLTTTVEGVGWVCGVSSASEPYLMAINLGQSSPVDEYPLTTSLGLGLVDDCAIASATIEVVHVADGEVDESPVQIRQVPVVVVAFRSDTVVKWGVVEAY
jgi:hypothetical protein